MEQMIKAAPETWNVMWEVFSVPFEEAAKLKRGLKSSGKIYLELVKRTEAGKADLEEFLLLTGKIGEKSTAQSIEEMIFPTEYEPPEIPNTVNFFPKAHEVASVLVTPSTPTSFDTKKMGAGLEIAWEHKETPATIKVKLKFDRVELLDFSTWGQGKATTNMPELSKQGFDKTVFLKLGKPELVGTMSPPRDRAAKNQKRRIWFAFATATPAEK